MKVIREICIAGKVIEGVVKVPSGRHTKKRQPKLVVTKEAVQKNNDRLAETNLRRLFNANCNCTWNHDTLTYAKQPTLEQALKILKNFIARIRRKMKKLGRDFKWIVATEATNRVHHHIVSNAPLEIMRETWREGHVLSRPCDDGPDYRKLAAYIIKETTKTFRQEDCPLKSRYSHSRNLIIPVVKVEEVSPMMLLRDPKPFKGYYIESDSIKRYEHPITGLMHLEYVMIAEDVEPRLKYWSKGNKKKREIDYSKYINYYEEQGSIFEFYEDVNF